LTLLCRFDLLLPGAGLSPLVDFDAGLPKEQRILHRGFLGVALPTKQQAYWRLEMIL
jgi:hypothetical protein